MKNLLLFRAARLNWQVKSIKDYFIYYQWYLSKGDLILVQVDIDMLLRAIRNVIQVFSAEDIDQP